MPFLLKIFITNNFIGRKKGRKGKVGRERQRDSSICKVHFTLVGRQVLTKVLVRRENN